jgi:trimethylamine--corrinoid protein Co-methyltransferase
MGCVPAQADLRSGAFVGGSAEFALLNAACAQIAQHLEVPLYNSSGISDSKVPDAQDDVNGSIMRMLKGIEVTEESLSLDVIDEVCKGPGHFLGHAQTLALMNSEYLYPGLLDRDSRDDWERKGARDIREAARARARKVLAEHWPEVIPEDLDAEIRRRFEILLPRQAMRPAA